MTEVSVPVVESHLAAIIDEHPVTVHELAERIAMPYSVTCLAAVRLYNARRCERQMGPDGRWQYWAGSVAA